MSGRAKSNKTTIQIPADVRTLILQVRDMGKHGTMKNTLIQALECYKLQLTKQKKAA
jgi:hypothetical protein